MLQKRWLIYNGYFSYTAILIQHVAPLTNDNGESYWQLPTLTSVGQWKRHLPSDIVWTCGGTRPSDTSSKYQTSSIVVRHCLIVYQRLNYTTLWQHDFLNASENVDIPATSAKENALPTSPTACVGGRMNQSKDYNLRPRRWMSQFTHWTTDYLIFLHKVFFSVITIIAVQLDYSRGTARAA